jgi:hypothetical protein
MAKYLDLDLYPEAREALAALSEYKLAILSNGSPKMLDALVHASGIARQLSDVISVDRAKTYKPDPKCYDLVAPALRVANHEVLFVSSNSFDVAGPKCFGFRAAWIERGGAATAPEAGPAGFYRLLRARAERLGYPADFRIGALSDLAPLSPAWVTDPFPLPLPKRNFPCLRRLRSHRRHRTVHRTTHDMTEEREVPASVGQALLSVRQPLWQQHELMRSAVRC